MSEMLERAVSAFDTALGTKKERIAAALLAALDPECDGAVDLFAFARYKAGGDDPGEVGAFRAGLTNDDVEVRIHCRAELEAAQDMMRILRDQIAQGETSPKAPGPPQA